MVSKAISAEPTPEELHNEDHFRTQTFKPPAASSRLAQARVDALETYMGSVGHIPMFTMQEEKEAAKRFRELRLQLWCSMLAQPRACQYIAMLLEEDEESLPKLRAQCEVLLKTHRSDLDDNTWAQAHANVLTELAEQLLQYDCDQNILDEALSNLHAELNHRQSTHDPDRHHIHTTKLAHLDRLHESVIRERNQFVKANLRLVISVARHFVHAHMPLIDLIQEGNMGLIKAIHRFDHRRGFRFSTYAHWWIRQSVERALINKGAYIRLPVHVLDAHKQANRAAIRAAQRLGRTATHEEVAQEAKITPKQLDAILNQILPETRSLDESVGRDDSRSLSEIVTTDGPLFDDALIRESSYAHMHKLLTILNPIERDILQRRFGLGSDTEETLEEIGKTYNLSRERVRQIQSQTIAKLKRLYHHKHADEWVP